MQDYSIRVIAAGGNIRALAASTTGLVEEARRRHGTSPTATAALGRVITAAGLLGMNLKGKETITLRVIGDGPLGGIIAMADGKGRVRGYVQHPQAELPSRPGYKLDVGGAVGSKGMLYVTKNLHLRDPYTSSVPLVSGEIGEDLASYLARSEQTPSAVALGVLVDTDYSVRAAGGYILQLMPGAGEDISLEMEQRLRGEDPVTALIDSGDKPEHIIERILTGWKPEILDREEMEFYCHCCREQVEKTIISMGEKELENMISQQGQADLRCHFCGDSYHFTRDELEQLLDQARSREE